ncbi:MAG: hypothetical protein KJN92_08610 [Gemmatimonadetes bacterium]|nr:hypothetical protein [Gemmatimonadota bacterium]
MRALTLLLPLLVLSCGWNAAGTTACVAAGPARALPDVLRESSGVAWSRSQDGILFSHNDGGHPASIYAIDFSGALLAEIPLDGASNRDWEDIATGECEAGSCIYIADVGDNEEVRARITLYRLPDPGNYDGTSQPADAFPMALPDGPRDMEALFVLPGERVFLVSKGRSDAVTLYRYPPPLRVGEEVTLEAVQTFSTGRLPIPRQVTGADATWDGKVVAIRTYEALTFFSVDEDGLTPIPGNRALLRTLQETQGEAVGLGPHGEVVLTSEGLMGRQASLAMLRCGTLIGGG